MQGLIIGRFQPVHNGHVELLKEVDEMGLEKLILGIGEEGKGRNPRNPFYFDEITQMWLPELKKLATPAELYKIPDIGDDEDYAAYVEKITSCNEQNTILVSGNDYTVDCFTNYGRNYKTKTPTRQIQLENKDYLCATRIRQWMANDGLWKEYVPESTAYVIEKTNGIYVVKYMRDEYEKQCA